MKISSIKYCVLCCQFIFGLSSLFAQNKGSIGDTVKVFYIPDFDNSGIDSIVGIRGRDSHSPWIVFFDKTEKIIAYKSYINGDSSISYDYWRNGQLKKKTIYIKKDSFYMWYYEEVYCENGQLIVKYFPNQIKSRWTYYYCSGNKRFQGSTFNGRPDSVQSYWYENGNVKWITNHKNVFDGIYTKIYRIGEWKYYNEAGKLDSTQVYDNNKLIKTIKN